jgi:hypothetical protein
LTDLTQLENKILISGKLHELLGDEDAEAVVRDTINQAQGKTRTLTSGLKKRSRAFINRIIPFSSDFFNH